MYVKINLYPYRLQYVSLQKFDKIIWFYIRSQNV